MVAFTEEVKTGEMLEVMELPQKNTFIHFDDTTDSDAELPPRSEATCPDLLLRRAFRTKTSIAKQQQRKMALHLSGECRPCAYFAFKTDGCRLGDDCQYCHLCTRRDIRKWKRAYAAKKTSDGLITHTHADQK
eukprot:TRINITY_DN4406_c1_g1_i1.p1 TRINITY_DN4406_c1_g1~~TRINITY_DN4406_c1_g1_i1.p1  ORF type:complete len:133 (-),score=27.28 TRINITY_DN4406_c1_g1_i1:109-507(-)